jgi:VIT1/CCC1 family predicted Fe2+/Mn2+ transporter
MEAGAKSTPSLRRRRVRAVITGVAFFFPGFLFSLPVTCAFAEHYYAGEAQASLAALPFSFVIGVVSAIACTVHLLRKANQRQ